MLIRKDIASEERDAGSFSHLMISIRSTEPFGVHENIKKDKDGVSTLHSMNERRSMAKQVDE